MTYVRVLHTARGTFISNAIPFFSFHSFSLQMGQKQSNRALEERQAREIAARYHDGKSYEYSYKCYLHYAIECEQSSVFFQIGV